MPSVCTTRPFRASYWNSVRANSMTFHLLPGQTPWSRCRLPVSVGSASLICVDFRLPNSQLPTIWRRESESNRRIDSNGQIHHFYWEKYVLKRY